MQAAYNFVHTTLSNSTLARFSTPKTIFCIFLVNSSIPHGHTMVRFQITLWQEFLDQEWGWGLRQHTFPIKWWWVRPCVCAPKYWQVLWWSGTVAAAIAIKILSFDIVWKWWQKLWCWGIVVAVEMPHAVVLHIRKISAAIHNNFDWTSASPRVARKLRITVKSSPEHWCPTSTLS